MQYRLLNYEEDDATFLLNSRLVGLIEPGCYRGFDLAPPGATLTLVLEHTQTGIQYVDSTAAVGAWRGMLMTKQGTIIQEDEAIQLSIPAGDQLPRIDLVVCNHVHALVTGGRTAYYTLVRGRPATVPVAPALPTPGSQTIVGQLYVPANTTTLQQEGVRWTLNRPEFANRTSYKLPDSVAHWTKRQQWQQQQLFSAIGVTLANGDNLIRENGTGEEAVAGTVMRVTSNAGVIFSVVGGGVIERFYVPDDRRQELFYLRFNALTTLRRGAPGANGHLDLITAELVAEAGDVALFYITPAGSPLLLQFLFNSPARLHQVNRYTRTQQSAVGTARFISFAGERGLLDEPAGILLADNGNAFELVIPERLSAHVGYLSTMPEGTEITLVANRAGRPAFTEFNSLPDWCFEDLTIKGGATREGYLPIRILANPTKSFSYETVDYQDTVRVTPQFSGGGVFKFLSFNNQWLLISISDTLPVHLHDRQQFLLSPTSPGSVLRLPLDSSSSSYALHSYTVPAKGRRDYLAQHTMSVAKITTKPELSIGYYVQGSKVLSLPFTVIDVNNQSQIISSTFLFERCDPGVVLELRVDRRDSSTNQISLLQSAWTLDGTPSSLV